MALHWSATKTLFVLAALGVTAGLGSALLMNQRAAAEPPLFEPAVNPYSQGIYANGILESDQLNGSNLNLNPQVPGSVTEILVHEGQAVKRGTPLLRLDDEAQRASTAQQAAQARAAQAGLDELKAQPRAETLHVVEAQLNAAAAAARTARDAFDKQQRAFEIDAHAVSRDTLDSARNAWQLAEANRQTAQRQLELTRAGAWAPDVRSLSAQRDAAHEAWQASRSMLDKYLLRAPADGVVLAIHAAVGSYVAPQGVFDSYTQSSTMPVLVLGSNSGHLAVRCYVDEILIAHLPAKDQIQALMSVRGTSTKVPLEFVRIEPYVTPKIALTDQRQERVDVRVLPVIFRFENKAALNLYAGQMVDVYIGKRGKS